MNEIISSVLAFGVNVRAITDYEVLRGNEFWRLLAVLGVVVAAIAAGRVVRFSVSSYAKRRGDKRGQTLFTLFLSCIAPPISVLVFAGGLHFCKLCLVFEDKEAATPMAGIGAAVYDGWTRVVAAIVAIAVAYAIYRLVDILEYYLGQWSSRTDTSLDDMLVPVIRKSLRVTVAIVATIYIVDNILEQDVRSILVSAGVGGIAIALAAKDTVANFFGSVTIFADRPFQMGEMVKVGDHKGAIESVGFRSTRIRTLDGHLVSVPNSMIVNTIVENIGRRPYIRRTSNITITYDTGVVKAERAVSIIREILAGVSEVNGDQDHPPRVYFDEFNDWSLNVYMSYWVKPPEFWVYQEVNQRVNLEMMRRFEKEGIEFAFPSQTLYLKKEEQ